MTDTANPSGGFDLTAVITPRLRAVEAMPKMLGAVAAARQQLEALAVQSGGAVIADAQLEGLRLVEQHLPVVIAYATQLEGIAAGLSVLKSPADMRPQLDALAAAIAALAAATAPPVVEPEPVDEPPATPEPPVDDKPVEVPEAPVDGEAPPTAGQL